MELTCLTARPNHVKFAFPISIELFRGEIRLVCYGTVFLTNVCSNHPVAPDVVVHAL